MPTTTSRKPTKKPTARKPTPRTRAAKPAPSTKRAAPSKRAPLTVSDEAVERATGRAWPEWFAILDSFTTKRGSHDHTAAAAHIYDDHACPAWWSQMVTVGWERVRGLRKVNQKTDGFSVSASRVINVPVAAAYKAWKPPALAKWLPKPGPKPFTVRKATANKSLRITWPDGKTDVEVMFYPKGPVKCQVTVQHNKLPNAAAGKKMKTYWGKAMDALRDALAK